MKVRLGPSITLTVGLMASLLWWPFSALADTDMPTLADLQQAIDNSHYAQAGALAHNYLEQHPGNRDARFMQALALAGQRRTDDALKAFKALANDYPLRAEPANDLAVLYAREGRYDKARSWLEKAMATQPAYATAHRNLGDVYTALADRAYRRALGAEHVAKKLPLTMLDRLYYAGESVAPGPSDPLPKPAPSDHKLQKVTTASAPPPTTTACPRPPRNIAKSVSPTPPLPLLSRPIPEIPRRWSKAAPLPKPNGMIDIIQTVRAWAYAWSEQDFDAYIGFYAKDFAPGDGRTRKQWRALRKVRMARADEIHIEIDEPRVIRIDADHVRVNFIQKYDSPRYSDVVSKELFMQRGNGGWQIVRESTGSSS